MASTLLNASWLPSSALIFALFLPAASAEADPFLSVELDPSDGEYFTIADGDVTQGTLELDGASTFTFEAWIKLFAIGSNQAILAKSSPGSDSPGSYQSRIGDNKRIQLTLAEYHASLACLSDTDLQADEWHHVAVAFDGGVCSFYLDGQADGTSSISYASVPGNALAFAIGAVEEDPRGSFHYFLDGRIAEVRVWSVARSQQEIVENRFELVLPEPDLIGHWRFDSGFLDSSCYGNDLSQHYNGTPIAFSADIPWPVCGASDTDLDAVCDDEDNCLLASNPSQWDGDLDGYGNACDADYDNNGVVGMSDFGRLRAAFGGRACDVAFDPALDFNDNGVVGMSDIGFCISRFGAPPGPSGLACAGSVPCPTP